MSQRVDTSFMAGPVRFSYMSLFQPRMNKLKNNGAGAMEYSATLLIPKVNHPKFCPDAVNEIAKIKAKGKEALELKFNVVPKKFDSCIKDGDKIAEGEEEGRYPGYWYVQAASKPEYPPVTINGKKEVITSGWQSGDWGKVKIAFWCWEFNGKSGLSCDIKAAQFLYHDEPFGVSRDPSIIADEFGAVADAEDEIHDTGSNDDYGDPPPEGDGDPFA